MLVLEAKVADGFGAPGDAGERMMYGWSVMRFLPTQMVERPSGASAP